MKCLILAAGYATRLYPLTENFPKPLLKVGNKTIVDWLVDDIASTGLVDEFVIISNHRFAGHFSDWAASRVTPAGDAVTAAGVVTRDFVNGGTASEAKRWDEHEVRTGQRSAASPAVVKLTVVDDGTESNETRLGAVCDIQYAVESLGIDDDLLVIAGDNVLDFSLSHFVKYALAKGTSCIMRHYEPDERRLHKSGIVEVDGNDLILSMEEKPEHPKSNWCCPPFYYYTKADAALVEEGIKAGCGTDAPGSYIAWLSAKVPVHAMQMPGSRYDIGNLESYRNVCENYKGITE